MLRFEAHIGLGLQILQQLAGINTVMYYLPVILELAGFRDKRSALLVAMAPAAVNALGTVVGMWLIDRAGRRYGAVNRVIHAWTRPHTCLCLVPARHTYHRKLLLGSLAGAVAALAIVGAAFYTSDAHASPVAFGGTCPAALDTTPNCALCLRHG